MDEFLKFGAYLLAAIVGWFVRVLWNAQKEMMEDMKKIELNIAENYTKRTDFKEVVSSLEAKMKEMTQPLNKKLDRIEDLLLNRSHHRQDDAI